MTRWFERLRWLRRPSVGATGELRNLRVIEIGHPWMDQLSRLSAYLVIIFVVAVTALQLRFGTPLNFDKGAIFIILVLYLIYVLLLETGSRALRKYYDLLAARLFRIFVNLTVVSALIYKSGGAESYFWCLYAVPLFQANMYLRRGYIVLTYVLTVCLYWAVSSRIFALSIFSPAFKLFWINSLVLFAMAVLLYWLFTVARAHRQIEKQNIARLQLLSNVSLKMTYASNLRDNLMTILREALSAVSADNGSMMIADPKTGALKILAWIIDNKEVEADGSNERHDGIAAEVARTHSAINCIDTETDSRFVKSEDRVIRSILSVPIVRNESLTCIINVDSPEPNRFKDEDVELLASLEEHVGTMIESLRLREIVLSLSSLPLDQLQSNIVESAFTLVRGDIVVLNLEDAEGSIKRVGIYPPDQETNLTPPRPDGLTRAILRDGQNRIINDVKSDNSVKPELKAHVKSLIAIPLLTTGPDDKHKAIGVLFVFCKERWPYGPSEKQILESLTRQAASAIIQRRLHDAVAVERDFQKRLLSSAFDAIIAIDKHGYVTEFNSQAEKILGYSREEVINQKVENYYRNENDAHEVLELLLNEKSKRRLIHHYTYVKAKNQDIIPIRLSAALLDEGSVGFFRDDRSDESRLHLQHLSGLLKTGQAITEQNELPATLSSVAEGTLETLHASIVWIYYYDHASSKFELPPVTAPPIHHDPTADFDLLPFLNSVMETGETYFLENLSNEAVVPAAFTQAFGLRSLAVGPLQVREKRLGVMICGYQSVKHFDDEEQITLRVLIGDAARATFQLEEQRQMNALLDGLYKTILNMTTNVTSESRLKQILRHAALVTRAEYGALGLLGPTKKIQRFIQVGVDDETMNKMPLPTNHGLLGRLLKPDEVINESDIRAPHTGFSGFGPRADLHPQITSFLGRAIMLNGKPIGNVYLGNKKGEQTFDDFDALVLGIFATSISATIHHQLDHQAWTMREAISLGAMLLAQLRQAGKEKWQTILSDLEYLSAGANQTQKETLNRIKEQIQQLDSVIEEVQLGINRGPSERVSLQNILSAIAPREDVPQGLLEIYVPRFCSVRGNALLLTLAFRILVANALKAVQNAPANRTKRVVLKCDLQDGVLKGSIKDSGVGIPQSAQTDLFVRPLERQNGRRTYGSYLAAAIMHWHGGGVRIGETGPEGTVIEFSIAEARD